MSEEKFDPVQEFITLRDNLTKTVEKQLRTISGTPVSNQPPIDLYETDEAVFARIEFPLGVKPDDLEIQFEKHSLTITGTTEDTLVEDGENLTFLQREIAFGPFSRTISIPRTVIAENASAKFKDGVLTIMLPKPEVDDPNIINIVHTD